jgi:hypothetical protein
MNDQKTVRMDKVLCNFSFPKDIEHNAGCFKYYQKAFCSKSTIVYNNCQSHKIQGAHDNELYKMTFSRLIRFEDVEGNKHFGEPHIKNADDLSRLLENGELFAHVLDGISPFNLSLSSQAGAVHQVKRILPVLRPADVPIIKCVGLNYIKHS